MEEISEKETNRSWTPKNTSAWIMRNCCHKRSKWVHKKKVGGVLEQDFAHGLPFCRMPFEGEEWLRNRENFIWPSVNTIERIKMLDCHVVAVGDKTSQYSLLEWRISYLLWEGELVGVSTTYNYSDLFC